MLPERLGSVARAMRALRSSLPNRLSMATAPKIWAKKTVFKYTMRARGCQVDSPDGSGESVEMPSIPDSWYS
jgi:hypothetical protein